MCHITRGSWGTFCNLSEAREWGRSSGCPCSGLGPPLAKSQPPLPQPLGPETSQSLPGNALDSGPIQSPLTLQQVWEGATFKACYSVTLPCLRHAPDPEEVCRAREESRARSPRRGGASPSWSPEIAHSIPPAPQNSPGRRQGLHVTDEEREAQKGAGACPRSPSKVKKYPEHLWSGKANVWRKGGEI